MHCSPLISCFADVVQYSPTYTGSNESSGGIQPGDDQQVPNSHPTVFPMTKSAFSKIIWNPITVSGFDIHSNSK